MSGGAVGGEGGESLVWNSRNIDRRVIVLTLTSSYYEAGGQMIWVLKLESPGAVCDVAKGESVVRIRGTSRAASRRGSMVSSSYIISSAANGGVESH